MFNQEIVAIKEYASLLLRYQASSSKRQKEKGYEENEKEKKT